MVVSQNAGQVAEQVACLVTCAISPRRAGRPDVVHLAAQRLPRRRRPPSALTDAAQSTRACKDCVWLTGMAPCLLLLLQFTILLPFAALISAQNISTSPVPPLQWINLTGLLQGVNKPPPLKNAAIGYDETRSVCRTWTHDPRRP